MGLNVEKMIEDRIVIMHFIAPLDPAIDVGAANEATVEFINEVGDGPIFRIEDVSTVDVTFNDVVEGTATSSKSGVPGSLADERVLAAMVGSNELAKLAASAMGGSSYGNVEVRFFSDMDVAIADCRARLQNA